MKLYDYTIFKQDGTTEEILGVKKKEFQTRTNQKTGEVNKGLYSLLGCTTIEVIPEFYYEGNGWGDCVVFGDEEGRFNSDNHRNPHFRAAVQDGMTFDVVGDCVRETEHRG